MLYEDNEYALYTVTLFNRDADNFKIKARERGFQVSFLYLFQVSLPPPGGKIAFQYIKLFCCVRIYVYVMCGEKYY